MNPTQKLSKTQIFYFPLEDKKHQFCQLKLLSNFIKYKFKKSVFKFSYVDSEGSMLGNLSLHENIELYSDNTDFDSFSRFEIEQIVNSLGNTHLNNFFQQLKGYDLDKNTADLETKKLIALFKSFFRSGPYFLYHSPEKYLKDQNLDLFLKALEFQSLTNEHNILVASHNQQLWHKHSTHIVKRDHSKKFQVLPIIRHSQSGTIIKKEKEVPNNETGLVMTNLNYKKVG